LVIEANLPSVLCDFQPEALWAFAVVTKSVPEIYEGAWHLIKLFLSETA